MNKLLYSSEIIAIPILRKFEGICPNFMVIEFWGGKVLQNYNPITEDVAPTNCINIRYKIVQREMLEATDTKEEEFIERTLLPSEVVQIPVEMLPTIFTHQSIKENLAIVNLALSRFSFRGVLSNLVLEVDEEVLDEIIAQEGIEANAQ